MMFMPIARILGIIGLVLIIAGLLLRNRKQRDILYVLGGFGLLVYSISIEDAIFIILQSAFILFTLYDIFMNVRTAKRKTKI